MPLTRIELLVLAVLVDGPRHGYGIVGELEARSRGLVSPRPGNLYRVIDRLLERGLLEPAEAPRSPGGGDDRRRYYRATGRGRALLDAEVEILARIVGPLDAPDGARP